MLKFKMATKPIIFQLRISLPCILRGTNWGASPKCLIRPVLEYGKVLLAAANN